MPEEAKAVRLLSKQNLTIQHIKKRKDFLYLSDKGKVFVAPAFVLKCAVPSRKFHSEEKSVPCEGGVRIGFVVRKKIGKAVIRNRIRRKFREISRNILPVYGVAGMDYVMIARDFALNRNFAKMKEEFITALKYLKSETEVE